MNSFIGQNSGHSNTTGNYRTALGASANSLGTNLDNSTGLGFNADCYAPNQVRIGNSSVTSIGGYSNWTNVSDARFKTHISEDVKGLEFITQLRPVSYQIDLAAIQDFLQKNHGEPDTATWQGKLDKAEIRYSGFIAQEVEAAMKESGYDFSGVDAPKNEGDFYGLRYAEFVVPLVKAVQELTEKVEAYENRLANLYKIESELDWLKTELETIKNNANR
jgi:hypothetical protein